MVQIFGRLQLTLTLISVCGVKVIPMEWTIQELNNFRLRRRWSFQFHVRNSSVGRLDIVIITCIFYLSERISIQFGRLVENTHQKSHKRGFFKYQITHRVFQLRNRLLQVYQDVNVNPQLQHVHVHVRNKLVGRSKVHLFTYKYISRAQIVAYFVFVRRHANHPQVQSFFII